VPYKPSKSYISLALEYDLAGHTRYIKDPLVPNKIPWRKMSPPIFPVEKLAMIILIPAIPIPKAAVPD
jgi:hypothetical protein